MFYLHKMVYLEHRTKQTTWHQYFTSLIIIFTFSNFPASRDFRLIPCRICQLLLFVHKHTHTSIATATFLNLTDQSENYRESISSNAWDCCVYVNTDRHVYSRMYCVPSYRKSHGSGFCWETNDSAFKWIKLFYGKEVLQVLYWSANPCSHCAGLTSAIWIIWTGIRCTEAS
jgi:hypothetical protein